MKIIIFSVIGLALGTLGGTAVGGLKGKADLLAEMEVEKAAQEVAQNAAHEGEDAVDSSEAVPSERHEEAPSPNDPAATHEADSAPPTGLQEVPQGAPEGVGAPDATASETPEEGPQTLPAGGGAVPGEEGPPLSEEGGGSARLAKIFGAMKAPDAAKVLQNLDDSEIQSILFHLTDRKAAEILTNFEPVRAATLSRAVLGSPGGEGS